MKSATSSSSGGGDDTITIGKQVQAGAINHFTLNGITAKLNIDTGTDANPLQVNDSGDLTGDTVTLDSVSTGGILSVSKLNHAHLAISL